MSEVPEFRMSGKWGGGFRLAIPIGLAAAGVVAIAVVRMSDRAGPEMAATVPTAEPVIPLGVDVAAEPSTGSHPDGVQEVVDLAVTDRPLTADFVEVYRVGDGADAWQEFTDVTGLGFDAGGNLHVANAPAFGELEAVIVSPRGELVATFGRTGDGPGEFRSVGSMVALADGRVAVSDVGHGAYHIFGSDGEFERLVRFPGGGPLGLDPVSRVFWSVDEMERILRADRGGNLLSRMARNVADLGVGFDGRSHVGAKIRGRGSAPGGADST